MVHAPVRGAERVRIKANVLFCVPKENQKSTSDFDALDPTGCGTQRPLRALGGTRVLLTAAPTTTPCIRRRRRSSLLHIFLVSPFYGFADGFTFLLDVASSKGVKSAAKQQIGEVQKNAFSEAASIFAPRQLLWGY